jgi:hypothetical protein
MLQGMRRVVHGRHQPCFQCSARPVAVAQAATPRGGHHDANKVIDSCLLSRRPGDQKTGVSSGVYCVPGAISSGRGTRDGYQRKSDSSAYSELLARKGICTPGALPTRTTRRRRPVGRLRLTRWSQRFQHPPGHHNKKWECEDKADNRQNDLRGAAFRVWRHLAPRAGHQNCQTTQE